MSNTIQTRNGDEAIQLWAKGDWSLWAVRYGLREMHEAELLLAFPPEDALPGAVIVGHLAYGGQNLTTVWEDARTMPADAEALEIEAALSMVREFGQPLSRLVAAILRIERGARA